MGYLISQAEGVLETTGVFAGMAALGCLVLAVDVCVRRLQRHVLRWKP
ncbi:hypothetical protein [Streptomyces sp. NPDC002054]